MIPTDPRPVRRRRAPSGTVRAALRPEAAVLVALALLALPAPQLAAQDEACLECHGSADELADLTDAMRPGLVVDGDRFARSVHASFACDDCHFDFESVPHEQSAGSAACADCHDDMADALSASVHGAAAGDRAASCADCHGVHDVLPSSERGSRLHPLEVPRTCGSCHFENDPAGADLEQILGEPLTDDAHAHGLLMSGLVVSATCVSCHGGHDVRAAGDPASRVSRANVAGTCGTCHQGVLEQYALGVHSLANVEAGSGSATATPAAAVCSDCHRPHDVDRGDPGSFRLSVVGECATCHQEQAASYHETFHGKLTNLGGERAAKCHDCHGAHGILPPSAPGSPLSPALIADTCARCHEGAHASFAEYLPHATHHDRERWPWLFWSFWGMTGLLTGTMVVALLHTLLFLVRLTLDRKHWQAHQRAVARGEGDQRLYLRFDPEKRTQHLLMVISFMTLALTGMAQKFSWTPWARWITDALGGVESIHLLHRLAALLLLGVFVWHIRSGLRAKRAAGRTWRQVVTGSDSILFNLHDLTEAKQTLRWFLGKGPRPAYGRFTYWEKFDYFAVFWGVAIIGLTGLSLWFPVSVTHVLPGWLLNVFAIIHGDEALLASAFIFTVHFFNANFRPDKFPMDLTMFTGRMKLAELEYERPREYRDLLASGELERRVVEPLPAGAVRTFRVFATLALLTGVGLIALIAYALATG